MTKSAHGNYFEDFSVGQTLVHATPRTITESDRTLYLALTGSRFAQTSSRPFALMNGLPDLPADDLFTFHVVFGKSVPDISVNAVANLGYADLRFHALVYPGETLEARSTVLGLKENRSGDSGIVWVRTEGRTTAGRIVVTFVRWVMVKKRRPGGTPAVPVVPELPAQVAGERLLLPDDLRVGPIDPAVSGSPWFFEDYALGEKIDHVDGMAVMESEHRLATRLYQNTARVHFDDHHARGTRIGRPLVYGGVVISLVKALAFNGLGNLLHVLAINGGRHVQPCLAGDTVYAWSEVLEHWRFPGRDDVGALRLRTTGLKNCPGGDFPRAIDGGKDHPQLLLDLDWWVLLPTAARNASRASTPR